MAYHERADYFGEEQRQEREREILKRGAHKHQVAETVNGNVLKCKCGAIMGFVRLPTKKASS